MNIKTGKAKEAELIAALVSESHKDVAEMLGLNINNAPKHPSFCTKEWVLSDFERGQEYFIYFEEGLTKGCVAFEQPDENTAYLNRLSVLPEYRRKGIGSNLVHHILRYAKQKKVKSVSIGIIAGHTKLKEWYLKFGFKAGRIQKFNHLPFDVLYMVYEINKEISDEV